MVDRQWTPPSPPGWAPPQPGYPAQPGFAFPIGPPRPVYREPHPIGAAPVLAGIGSTLVWLALFGALGRGLVSYTWWTVVAAVSAWAVALVLTFLGDRGVATGVAVTAGFGLSVATTIVAVRWIATSNWPLW